QHGFLSSNQAKMTCFLLFVLATSTPRQPGVALRAATRSGNPFPGSGLSSGFGGSPAVGEASSPTQTITPRITAHHTLVFIESSHSASEFSEHVYGMHDLEKNLLSESLHDLLGLQA